MATVKFADQESASKTHDELNKVETSAFYLLRSRKRTRRRQCKKKVKDSLEAGNTQVCENSTDQSFEADMT